MAWNGSGSFSRTNGTFAGATVWAQDNAAGNNIVDTRHDSHDQDLAAGINNCVAKDGQNTPTASLPMGGFRHTGVGNGSARSDYAALGQVQDGTPNWVAAAGTADALTATYSPALTALVDGQLCFVRAASANATTTPSFSPNGLTAHPITRSGGVAVVPGEWAANQELALRYNLASTRWETLAASPGMYLIGTGVAAASSSVNFTSGISSAFDEYEVRFNNVVPATAATALWMRISQSAVFKNGATDYRHCRHTISDGGGHSVAASTGDTQLVLTSGMSNVAGRGLQGTVRFARVGTSSELKLFRWELAFFDGTNSFRVDGEGLYVTDGNAIDGIQFFASSGALTTGIFALYGIRKA